MAPAAGPALRAVVRRAIDCASFEVIRRLKLDGAFAFDLGFVACGFRMLP